MHKGFRRAKRVRTHGPGGDGYVSELYSTIDYDGKEQYEFFTKTGSAVGEEKTNIEQAGQVPSNETYQILQIGIRTVFQTPAGQAIAPLAAAAEIDAAIRLFSNSAIKVAPKGKEDLGIFKLSHYLNVINAAISSTTPVNQVAWINLPVQIPLNSLVNWKFKLATPVAITELVNKFSIECVAPIYKQRQS